MINDEEEKSPPQGGGYPWPGSDCIDPNHVADEIDLIEGKDEKED